MNRESIVIRQAQKADLPTIRQIVRAANLPPVDLQWRHFLVAEENGVIIGVGQVRYHSDGSRELGSLAVVAERRGAGIGRALVQALIARTPGVLYLFCRDVLENYYNYFGFHRAALVDLPPVLARRLRIANAMIWMIRFFRKESLKIIAMRRTG